MEGSFSSVFSLLIKVVLVAVLMASLWKVFVKAGIPGWKALIPWYNAFLLVKIAGKPGWWFLLFIIPVVNIGVAFITMRALAKAFGKGTGFAVGLCLLCVIFFPILGFGAAEYTDPLKPVFKLKS